MDQSGGHENASIEDIQQAVIEFLKTINNLSKTPTSLEELSDGVVLMELLQKINSEIFDIDQIEMDTDDNWALKHKNITKLINSLEQYYHNILKFKEFDKDSYLDASEISQNKNKHEIVKLVELSLGVIVQSEQKFDFIHAITLLEKKYQTILMHLMQKWIVQEALHTHEGEDLGSQENISSQRLSIMQNSNHSYHYQQNQQLIKKIDELEHEKVQTHDKLEELRQELREKDHKIVEFEKEINIKDDEIKKLKLSHDSAMISLGMNVNDDFESAIKTKDLKIDSLNSMISQIQQQSKLENDKLNDEIQLLNKKLKQLQKISESLDFYKQKYDEYTSLSEKFQEVDKKAKQFDKTLSDKDNQIEMLMEKLQEFKSSYTEEKKKSMEKAIELSQKDHQIEQFKLEIEQLENKYSIQEEKLHDMSSVLEHYQHEESHIRQNSNNLAKNLSIDKKQSNEGQQGNNKREGPKGLNEDLSQIISELERENIQLKSEQNTSLDPSFINLEDTESLKEQIDILQTKLTEKVKLQHDLEAKIAQYQKCDVQKLKEDNEKLRSDYQSLLSKSLKRQVSREEEFEGQLKSLQETNSRRDSELKQNQQEKSRLIEDLESKVIDLQQKINIQNEEIKKLSIEIDEKDKKFNSQQQQVTTLFQNKQIELELLFELLKDMRQKYSQVQTQQQKSNFC